MGKLERAVKARTVYKRTQIRKWSSREDSGSPAVSLESMKITAVIDANEGCDAITADVPLAFIYNYGSLSRNSC